jgi:mRNA interferase MazF
MDMVREFNVHHVNLDPAIGLEMKKVRPCVVLSPSKMNSVLGTAVIAPLTTTLRKYPSRVEIRFGSKFCEVCLDQIRAVDAARLSKESLGRLKQDDIDKIKDTFAEVFEL